MRGDRHDQEPTTNRTETSDKVRTPPKKDAATEDASEEADRKEEVSQVRAMSRISAGLLMYRIQHGTVQVLLAHPGGPFFQKKDTGAWSIPKGEVEPDEDYLNAAKREFEEEIGVKPAGPFMALTPVKQKGGKVVHAWAFQGDCNPEELVSNTFTMEWPPKSGRQAEFPEIDRAEFFNLDVARSKINPAQVSLIDELEQQLGDK